MVESDVQGKKELFRLTKNTSSAQILFSIFTTTDMTDNSLYGCHGPPWASTAIVLVKFSKQVSRKHEVSVECIIYSVT